MEKLAKIDNDWCFIGFPLWRLCLSSLKKARVQILKFKPIQMSNWKSTFYKILPCEFKTISCPLEREWKTIFYDLNLGSESGEQQLMVNSFLWNPFISGHHHHHHRCHCCHRCYHHQQQQQSLFIWFLSAGVENFIMTTVYGYPESETTCLVDDVYDQSQVFHHHHHRMTMR